MFQFDKNLDKMQFIPAAAAGRGCENLIVDKAEREERRSDT